jgi:predicted protein tyrosine phosphatase
MKTKHIGETNSPLQTMNDIIFSASSPWDNPYQGKDRKVLFVCSAGILRSATCARIYAAEYNTRCAGSEYYALIPVTADLLAWAETIVFVNQENTNRVSQKFDLDDLGKHKEIVTLNIPDQYEHMDPVLIRIIKEQLEGVL